MNKVIQQYFEHLNYAEQILILEAKERNIFQNPGTKGSVREDILKADLRQRLPVFIDLGKGEIFDSNGGMSAEFDLVLNDRLLYPVAFNIEQHAKYFVETIIAVFEIKSKIGKKEIKDSKAKFDGLSSLKRKYLNNPHFQTTYNTLKQFLKHLEFHGITLAKPLEKFPAYLDNPELTAYEKDMFVSPIKRILFGYDSVSEKTLLQHLNETKLEADFICVLNKGCYWQNKADGKWCRFSKEHSNYLQFVYWLSEIIIQYITNQTITYRFSQSIYFNK